MTQGPNATPLAQAAGAGIGVNPVTPLTKTRDVIAAVLVPFAVPAMVLALSRSNQDFSFGRSLAPILHVAGLAGLADLGVSA